jgi:hypothetical protein
MTASPETPGSTPEPPTDTDAAVSAVIAGWNDEARDERDPAGTGTETPLTPPPPAATTTPSNGATFSNGTASSNGTAFSNGTAPVASALPRPTVRWGAIVWSLLFAALAGTSLWLMLDPERREATGEWLATLSPLAAALYGLVALGVILALFGIVGLIRRGERADR